ncbi:ABC transporter ATP-binding protein [Phycicoccus flavus]|uniref:ABC transporter ATP-binding protein n=1 Tax=Phycicoccus flavus TaxID=2502783 RepID=A0A8T6R318_9MICO|nr:ABC transporter ATP-binding protein [Phycicoccus flavus]NHA68778.1 ABC transporter ATP-binding protein [Phycicoccus flavus]
MFGIPRGIAVLFSPENRVRLLLAVVGSVVTAFLEVVGVASVVPLMQLLTGADTGTGLLGRFADVFGNPPRDRLALVIAVLVFASFILKAVIGVAFRWWMAGFLARQEADTSQSLLRRYLAAPYWVHLSRHTSEFNRTMTESAGQTYAMVVTGAIIVATEAVTVLALTVVILVLDPVPAVVAIVYFSVVAVLFQRTVGPRAENVGRVFQEASLDMSMTAWETIQGIKEIRVRRTSDQFLARYREARLRYAGARRANAFLADLPKSIFELVFIGGVAVLVVVAFSTGNSSTTLTTLSLFVAAGFRLLPSLTRIMASLQLIRTGRAGLTLVLADLTDPDLPDVPGDDPTATGRMPLTESLVVRDAIHRYRDGTTNVLDGVSVVVPAGTSVAFVGTSGAGKTTLVDTVLGLHEPVSGEVLADGRPITDDLPGWQRNVGLVPQDVFIPDDTVRANIALGEPPEIIDEERVLAAVRDAELEPLIAALPDGLDSRVGERGSRLSGGQRQRLGIARALYRKPALLVLDEATSALDNETERRVAETVAALRGRMTVIIVAHRLSTVRDCDQVVFLKAGQVEAAGTFEEVRRASPDFAHLVRLGRLEPVPAGGDRAE